MGELFYLFFKYIQKCWRVHVRILSILNNCTEPNLHIFCWNQPNDLTSLIFRKEKNINSATTHTYDDDDGWLVCLGSQTEFALNNLCFVKGGRAAWRNARVYVCVCLWVCIECAKGKSKECMCQTAMHERYVVAIISTQGISYSLSLFLQNCDVRMTSKKM